MVYIFTMRKVDREAIFKRILNSLDEAWDKGLIGRTIIELQSDIGISRVTLPKYLDMLKVRGLVKERKIGQKVKFYVSRKRYRK